MLALRLVQVPLVHLARRRRVGDRASAVVVVLRPVGVLVIVAAVAVWNVSEGFVPQDTTTHLFE